MITIKENGAVRINDEVADLDNLIEQLNPIGEYKTSDGKTLVLFKHDKGFIEYLLNSTFASGEQANFTEMSYSEIMEYYEVI